MVNFEVLIDSVRDGTTAVSVCGKVSGYRKGKSSLPEANVGVVLPNRDSQCLIVRNK